MNNKDWIEQELAQHHKDEIEAVNRVIRAQKEVSMAKAELAAAKEYLEGVRGGIKELEFQMDYFDLHGRLP
jgi:uncharacterized protein YnzC (UPF0291/DUF896 family)